MIPNNGPGGHKTSKTHSYISQIIPLHDHLSPAIRRYDAWFWVWQPSTTGEKVVFMSTTQSPCHCIVLANRSNQTIGWLIIIWPTLSTLKRTWWYLYSDLSATTKPPLRFSRGNLICLTMMSAFCRPLLQESSNNRLRKGQYIDVHNKCLLCLITDVS